MPYNNDRVIYRSAAIVVAILISIIGFTQNLVPNPRFEELVISFDGIDEIYAYEFWTPLLKFKKTTRSGIPDYKHYMTQSGKHEAFWRPDSGNSFFYTQIPYLRNLYQARLTQPLLPDVDYHLSFRFKINADGFTANEIVDHVNGKIGAKFSPMSLTDSIHLAYWKNQDIVIKPEFGPATIDKNTEGAWQNYEVDFSPEKELNYIIIGNFEKIIEAHQIKYHPIEGMTVLIDNVSVKVVDD